MLRISLGDLKRKGSSRIQDRIPQDDPLWEDSGLGLSGDVSVDVDAAMTASGQVLVRGQAEAPVARECRRCVERVELTVTQPLTMVWTAPDELGVGEEEDGEARVLPPNASEIVLDEAIREELVLGAPVYVVCSESCKGLCARCGANLNEGDCGCVPDDPDPRWDALRALNND